MIEYRRAKPNDLSAIVKLLADDFLGAQRESLEDPLPPSYLNAFHAIDTDPNNELIVAELEGKIIGTFQLIFTSSLSFQGGKRCTVESVRVDQNSRGQGIGHQMMKWAIERAREEGCISIQLTTNNQRDAAHRFYERLGFESSHLGMKLKLN